MIKKSRITKPLCAALSAALIIASPGPFAARAAASAFKAASVRVAGQGSGAGMAAGSVRLGVNGVIPNLGASGLSPSLHSLSLPPSVIPTLNIHAPASAVSLTPSNAVVTANHAINVLPAVPGALNVGTAPNGVRKAFTVRSQLSDGVRKINKSAAPSARFSTLRNFFSGSRNGAGVVSALGHADEAAESADAGFGKLESLGLGELEGIALDENQPLEDRIKAVERIGKQDGEVQGALGRVADARPEGGAQDYEVHRAALKLLAADFGDVRSLRPISIRHAEEIKAQLKKDKPEMLISDYDDTLAEFRQPISEEMAAAFASVADVGVEPVVLTDRSDVKRFEKDVSILDSLEPMTPAQKSKIAVISSKGTKTTIFDKKGRAVLLEHEQISWTAAERTAIQEASSVIEAEFGRQEYPAESGEFDNLSEYSYARFLPLGMAAAKVQEAAERMQKELESRGITDYEVIGRTPAKPENPAYIALAKTDKSIGVKRIRSNRRVLESVRDLLNFGLPRKWVAGARRLVNRFAKRPIATGKTLLLGDQFMGQGAGKGTDEFLIKGAPDAMAISVGPTADPRHDNLFLWPKKGPAGTLDILKALGEKAPSDMDKKAVIGMFSQRTVGISVFVLQTLAFTALAVNAVGWAGYGSLIALGTLAMVAAGPLNGWIIDNFSARTTMSATTALRVVLSLMLPVFAAFGVLNFGTLLIASFANYLVLSSVMVTETAYVKRFGGQKHLGAIQGGLLLNYFLIQVVVALIFGLGSLVGVLGAINIFYLVAAVNALLVLPIVWFTMPTKAPNTTIPKMEARLRAVEQQLTAKPGGEALGAEAEALRRDIENREASLRKQISDNQLAGEENTEKIRSLQVGSESSGWWARRKIISKIKPLEMENLILAEEAVSARNELERIAPQRFSTSEKLSNIGSGALSILKKWWPSMAAITASFAIYNTLWASAVPITLALIFAITQTRGYKLMRAGRGRDIGAKETALAKRLAENELELKQAGENKEALLKENRELKAQLKKWKNAPFKAMLYIALIAVVLYPLQYFGVPRFTEAMTGLPMDSPASAELYGRYLGALFFGNLIATGAQARLPEIRLPILGHVPMQRLIQAVVIGLAGVWSYTSLFAGSILAAAAAMAIAAALMYGTLKPTNRAWVKFLGLGAAAIWLPYLFWGSTIIPAQMAMYLSLLAIGMVYGPAFVSLITQFFGSFKNNVQGMMAGVQGSFLNAAVAISIGLAVTAYSALTPAFPTLLVVFGVVYALVGLLMWRAPKDLPGLPKDLLHRSKKKR